ncbi:MAG: MalY/PatB family protein [Dehalococcoidales bacterium]|nr:MalY/PatB family protein [Dehalococcoidales bacterium]
MKYDFDVVINRRGTGSAKWDRAEQLFKIKDILPMWVADMDFRSPEPVIKALKKVAERGIFGYTTVPDSYYNALIGWMEKRHQWEIQREWIVLTTGVVPAIRLLVKAFTQPGDQVIVQTPVYYPFFDAIRDNGCEILDNPLRLEAEQYVMDIADLESKITTRTKMILLCSPHNPISRVWTKKELKRLGDLCIRNNILVVSDEIHEDLIYRGFKHVPFTSVSSEFTDKAIVCTAASKTFNLPGLRTSNIIISNPELKKQFTSVMRNCGMSPPSMFGIAATEAAYRYGESWLEQLLNYLQGNMEFFIQFATQRIPGLKVIQPQGTYLLWLDFRNCGIEHSRLGRFVREDAKVGLEGGTQFGCREDGFERMNIACPRAILTKALNRIEKAVKA